MRSRTPVFFRALATGLRVSRGNHWLIERRTEDGKELKFDTEKLGITDITEEANRHSRLLTRKADLGIK